MPIPASLRTKYIYHFTHINNLQGIISNGLTPTNSLIEPCHSIAFDDIQNRRAEMNIPCRRETCVHDYVPFYFCARTPMLYTVVAHGTSQNDIVYLRFPITILEEHNGIYTSASANTAVPPAFFDDLNELEQNVDWEAVNTRRWGNQYNIPGEQPVCQRKMAEALIPESIPFNQVEKIITTTDQTRDTIIQICQNNGREAIPSFICNHPYTINYYFYNDDGSLKTHEDMER